MEMVNVDFALNGWLFALLGQIETHCLQSTHRSVARPSYLSRGVERNAIADDPVENRAERSLTSPVGVSVEFKRVRSPSRSFARIDDQAKRLGRVDIDLLLVLCRVFRLRRRM